MSRFNNVKAVFGTPRGTGAGVEQAEAPPVKRPAWNPQPWNQQPLVAPAKPAAGRTERSQVAHADFTAEGRPSPDSNVVQVVGFAVLCIYLISGYANEFAIRALGFRTYVSAVAVVIMPGVLILSGNLFRGLRDNMGRLWLGFLAWICLAIPFSVWRGGSIALLRDYVPRSWVLLFLIAGFVVSLKHCKRLMEVMIAANVLLLVDCAVAARITDGRLDIPDSLFFANANDLSLQLGLAITQFLYLLFQPQIWKRVVAVAGIIIALAYSFQTGSRAGVIAVVVLGVIILVIGNHRLLLATVVLVAAAGAIVFVPSTAFHRILLLSADAPVESNIDLAAVGSRAQRLELLQQSLDFTFTHPIFGVGPGQFAVAVYGDAEKEGKRASWLGTHNSYTQVSSECGIPAFALYTSVIFLCLWSNFRMYRRSRGDPRLLQVNALAFSVFCGAVVYAVATFFYHIAYSGYLPELAGMTVALRLATDGALRTSRLAGKPSRASARA